MLEFNKIYCNGLSGPECIDNTPVFTWNFKTDYERNISQTSFVIEIFDDNKKPLFSCENEGDSMRFKYEGKLEPLSEYYWRVIAGLSNGETLISPMQHFCTGLLQGSFEAFGANWIAGSKPYEREAVSFKKTFCVAGEVASAAVYSFATSWQRLTVNGEAQKEGEYLTPLNSPYTEKCIYDKYDITSALKQGENEISLLLGGGHNANYSGWGWRITTGKALIAIIDITYENGEHERIVTDNSWLLYSSPITLGNIYDGEHYDATIVPARLENAAIIPSPVGNPVFTANETKPIKVIREIEPVNAKKTQDGILYDIGENVAGFAKIELSAPKGTKIGLQFSELVYNNGEQRTTTNVIAEAYDEYICSGNGIESYSPTFTYHGFRYVKVTGLSPNVEGFKIWGMALASDFKNESFFLCSDNTVNRIHENVRRSLESNLIANPTDCPVRDERTPCALDSIGEELPAIYNFDVQAFYNNWAENLIVGKFAATDHDNPDWDGDKILMAYRLLHLLGDSSLAEKYYGELKANVEHFASKCVDYECPCEGFGDWCHTNDNVFAHFYGSRITVNTNLLYKLTNQMAEISEYLKAGDTEYYIELAKNIKNAFRKKYVDSGRLLDSGTQIDQIMALYSGILPESVREDVLQKFCQKLETEIPNLGIFGVAAMAEVLPRMGKSDLLLSFLRKPDYPSFSYQLANGATSLWEQWSFDGRMNSHSHVMFAGIENAFYRGFMGIKPLKHGFKSFEIKPQLPQEMNFISCAVETVSGTITADYADYSYGSEMKLTVPVNTKACVYIPHGGRNFSLLDGEVLLGNDSYQVKQQYVELELGGGFYNIRLVDNAYLFENTYENRFIRED